MAAARTKVGMVALAIVMVAAAAGAGGVAYASHQFSDVSGGHTFHDEIGRIADAGITTGYDDGSYRPGAAVSRGAMAAFMSRGFSRVSYGVGSEDITTDTPSEVAGISIDAGAAAGGNGWVVVTANLELIVETGCPCTIRYGLDTSPAVLGGDYMSSTVGAPGEAGVSIGSVSIQEVFPVAGGATGTYYVNTEVVDGNATNILGYAQVTAVYIPFAGLETL